MKFISNIFRRFGIKDQPKTLGRWNIDYCNVKMDKKIDLSNEDHCGPCGQYAINKTLEKSLANVNPNNNLDPNLNSSLNSNLNSNSNHTKIVSK